MCGSCFRIGKEKWGFSHRKTKKENDMKFVKGMDLSTLLELEKCGAKYYVDGTETDILDIMKKYPKEVDSPKFFYTEYLLEY